MISRRPERVGTSKWIERSNRPGRSSAGSRSAARLVAPITRMFENTGGFFFKRRCAGQPAVGPVDQPRLHAAAAGRRVERLELDQQLVDDARDALARRAALDLRSRVQHALPSGVLRMPLRAPAIASISSMKPIAPPSSRAALRSSLK